MIGDGFWRDFDRKNRWAGEAAFWLGRCYSALGREAESKRAYAHAVRILAESAIPGDSKLIELARRG